MPLLPSATSWDKIVCLWVSPRAEAPRVSFPVPIAHVWYLPQLR